MPVQQHDFEFCQLCLKSAQNLTHYYKNMAESPSKGCELEDENGKKLFSCLKYRASIFVTSMHSYLINNAFVFVNTFQ